AALVGGHRWVALVGTSGWVPLLGTCRWHFWAQVGGTAERHRWVHCWAQVGALLGTGGRSYSGRTAVRNLRVALLGTDHQGTDHQCPDDRVSLDTANQVVKGRCDW
ncbi:unnamed protein product, partial [Staurois parvus]